MAAARPAARAAEAAAAAAQIPSRAARWKSALGTGKSCASQRALAASFGGAWAARRWPGARPTSSRASRPDGRARLGNFEQASEAGSSSHWEPKSQARHGRDGAGRLKPYIDVLMSTAHPRNRERQA